MKTVLIACMMLLAAACGQSPQESESSRGLPVMKQSKDGNLCAADRDARALIVRANGDREAYAGLVERGRAIPIGKETAFEGKLRDGPWVWGYIRSGRQIGRDCWSLEGMLE